MDQQPPQQLGPDGPPNRRRPHVLLIVLGAAMVLIGMCVTAVASIPKTPQGEPAAAKVAVSTVTPTARPTPVLTATPTPTPVPARIPAAMPTAAPAPAAPTTLTVDQKAKVQAILQGAVDHYTKAFSDGQVALSRQGTNDFYIWRQSTRIEQDLSWSDALKQAADVYNGNQPDALYTWGDDTNAVSAAISQWITVAVSWQINQKSNADLQAAAAAVTAKADAAHAGVMAVVAAS